MKATLAEMRAARRAAQPSGIKTFGSTFKNPDDPRAEGRSAGVLLDEAGCRGLTVGGARFSEKHANFVENMGEATTADVIALMGEGRRRVRERFGVELEPEVQFLGEVDTSPLWTGELPRARAARVSGAVAGRRPARRAPAARPRHSPPHPGSCTRFADLSAFALRVLTLRFLPPRMRRRVFMVLAAASCSPRGYQLLAARLLARGRRAGEGDRPHHQGRRARPRRARLRRTHDDHAARRPGRARGRDRGVPGGAGARRAGRLPARADDPA